MDPIVQKKIEEIRRMAADKGVPSGVKKQPVSSHVRVIDNNLSKVIRNKEEADRFWEQVEAIFAYQAIKRKKEKEEKDTNK